jgi:hypothetical protein
VTGRSLVPLCRRLGAAPATFAPVSTAPETPADSPLTLDDVMGSAFHRDLMTAELAAGDEAFLFELPTPAGEVVRLADHVGARPVALVFGSET